MRILKQILYGIFWLVFFSAIGYGGYKLFFAPAPSCFDKVQNQGELGVDCGPVCGNICLPADITQNLKVQGAVNVLPIGSSTDHASFLVQIQNLNTDYAAKDFKYDLKINYGSGSSADVTGDSFVFAGDKKYLAFPNVPIAESPETMTADFTMSDPQWVQDQDFAKPPTTLQNSQTQIFSDHIEVNGKFVNNDAGTIPKTTIVAVLYSAEGLIIGISQTEVQDVTSGEARDFTVIHPFIPGVNTSQTQVFIYPQR